MKTTNNTELLNLLIKSYLNVKTKHTFDIAVITARTLILSGRMTVNEFTEILENYDDTVKRLFTYAVYIDIMEC